MGVLGPPEHEPKPLTVLLLQHDCLLLNDVIAWGIKAVVGAHGIMPEESLCLVTAAFLLTLLRAIRHLFQAVRWEPSNTTFDLAFPEASFPDAKYFDLLALAQGDLPLGLGLVRLHSHEGASGYC